MKGGSKRNVTDFDQFLLFPILLFRIEVGKQTKKTGVYGTLIKDDK